LLVSMPRAPRYALYRPSCARLGYAFSAPAAGLVAAYVAGGSPVPRLGPIGVIAFVFSVFTLYGCGTKPVLFGTIMLVLGIPVYVWQQRRRALSPL
jgi:APA family basic amino acid/polyamine antiporter